MVPPSDGQRTEWPGNHEAPTSATGSPQPTLPSSPSAAATFANIGRYAVLEEVGRGGMGTVVRAYDPKLRREVALKRVASHALGSEAEARLVREAQAMAQLSHPNVVAIHDVEVGADGVTIVMEYVAGQTLSEWLRARNRAWMEIVAAFRDAGAGIAAAHRVGLVHRDFKPTNVLVDADGRVKVTDFGLAKAAMSGAGSSREAFASRDESADDLGSSDGWRSVDEGTTLTRADVVMGTPPFMAPEQHEGRLADARADQYAFCVSLWLGLVGKPPFRGPPATLLVHKRSGPPPWPKGSDVPRRIVAAIERGLAPDPDARWPSMDALLAALTHDPLARRRRLVLLAGLGVLVALAATPLVLRSTGDLPCTGAAEQMRGIWDEGRRQSVLAGLAGSELAYADATAERVGAHVDRYTANWIAQHTDACEATAVRGDQSSALMDLRMTCLQHARQRLVAVVDVLAQPDMEVVVRAVTLVHGLPSIDHCADAAGLQSEAPMPSEPELAEAVEAQRAELARGRALVGVGKYQPGLEIAVAVETVAMELDFPPLIAEAKAFHGAAAMKDGRYDEAHELLTDALQRALADRQAIAVDTAVNLALLAADRLGRPEEGHAWASVAIGLARARDPGGRLEASANSALGASLQAEGRYEEALAAYQRTVAFYERAGASDDPNLAGAISSVSSILKALGRYREAEAAAVRANDLIAKIQGPEHPGVAATMNSLAGVLLDKGETQEAERILRASAELRRRSLGPEHPLVAASLDNLAGVLARLERLEEAEATAREAFAIAQNALGPDNPEMALFYANMGTILARRGRYEQALEHLERALEIQDRTLGVSHPASVVLLDNLAEALLRLGRVDDAIGALERSWTTANAAEVAPEQAARCGAKLASALWLRPADRKRAIEIARTARARLERAGEDANAELLASIDAWLREPSGPS